jgi:ribosomal protein L15E
MNGTMSAPRRKHSTKRHLRRSVAATGIANKADKWGRNPWADRATEPVIPDHALDRLVHQKDRQGTVIKQEKLAPLVLEEWNDTFY